MEWHATAADDAEIEVTVKCAANGDETTERVYRHKGLRQVSREFLEELYTAAGLDELEAESLLITERLQASGAIAQAREELDQAGIQ